MHVTQYLTFDTLWVYTYCKGTFSLTLLYIYLCISVYISVHIYVYLCLSVYICLLSVNRLGLIFSTTFFNLSSICITSSVKLGLASVLSLLANRNKKCQKACFSSPSEKHHKSVKLTWHCNIWNSLFCVFGFLARHHSDQMSQGSEVSNVTTCVQTQKWQPQIAKTCEFAKCQTTHPSLLQLNFPPVFE